MEQHTFTDSTLTLTAHEYHATAALLNCYDLDLFTRFTISLGAYIPSTSINKAELSLNWFPLIKDILERNLLTDKYHRSVKYTYNKLSTILTQHIAYKCTIKEQERMISWVLSQQKNS